MTHPERRPALVVAGPWLGAKVAAITDTGLFFEILDGDWRGRKVWIRRECVRVIKGNVARKESR